MSNNAQRFSFPLRIASPEVQSEAFAVLEADGSWKGDANQLAAALGRMQAPPGSLEPLIMWLLLREMQRGNTAQG